LKGVPEFSELWNHPEVERRRDELTPHILECRYRRRMVGGGKLTGRIGK
jgi:hypothetical protein